MSEQADEHLAVFMERSEKNDADLLEVTAQIATMETQIDFAGTFGDSEKMAEYDRTKKLLVNRRGEVVQRRLAISRLVPYWAGVKAGLTGKIDETRVKV